MVLMVDNMLVSLVLAFVIAYSLKPWVNFLERSGLTRTTAISIPFITVGLIISLAVYLLLPLMTEQIRNIKADLPLYIDGLKKLLLSVERMSNDYVGPLIKDSSIDRVALYFQDTTEEAIQAMPSIASKIFMTAVLAPFFAFFILRDGRKIMKQILELVPNNLFELALNLTHQINQQMGGFIRARVLESLIVGGCVWLGLFMISFPYSAILAIFAGLTNLIPYIGPVIGAVPAFLVALINKDPSSTIFLIAIIYFIAQLLDMLVIIPLVVAKIVNLHPVTVVVVILIGSQVMGILGMIISIPVASTVKLATHAIYRHLIGFKV